MPIPQSRADLVHSIKTEFGKLEGELSTVGPEISNIVCVDEWTVKQLLAIRLWWTRSVLDWVERGKRGEIPETPAEGYRWRETPRLNNDIAQEARKRSYKSIRSALGREYERLLVIIDSLDDKELLDVGVFEWAGRWPISRWLSINTTRQYHTACTYVRKAKKSLET